MDFYDFYDETNSPNEEWSCCYCLFEATSSESFKMKDLSLLYHFYALRLFTLLGAIYSNTKVYFLHSWACYSPILLFPILHMYLLPWSWTWSFAGTKVILYYSSHGPRNLLVFFSVFSSSDRYLSCGTCSESVCQCSNIDTLCGFSSFTSLSSWNHDLVTTLPFRFSSQSSSLLIGR